MVDGTKDAVQDWDLVRIFRDILDLTSRSMIHVAGTTIATFQTDCKSETQPCVGPIRFVFVFAMVSDLDSGDAGPVGFA